MTQTRAQVVREIVKRKQRKTRGGKLGTESIKV